MTNVRGQPYLVPKRLLRHGRGLIAQLLHDRASPVGKQRRQAAALHRDCAST
jgi:hypothetical protein